MLHIENVTSKIETFVVDCDSYTYDAISYGDILLGVDPESVKDCEFIYSKSNNLEYLIVSGSESYFLMEKAPVTSIYASSSKMMVDVNEAIGSQPSLDSERYWKRVPKFGTRARLFEENLADVIKMINVFVGKEIAKSLAKRQVDYYKSMLEEDIRG